MLIDSNSLNWKNSYLRLTFVLEIFLLVLHILVVFESRFGLWQSENHDSDPNPSYPYIWPTVQVYRPLPITNQWQLNIVQFVLQEWIKNIFRVIILEL